MSHPVISSYDIKIKLTGWYNRGPPEKIRSLISIRDPAEHRRRRKTWERALSAVSIKNYYDIIVRREVELGEQFEKRAGQEIDFSMWMSYFSSVFSFIIPSSPDLCSSLPVMILWATWCKAVLRPVCLDILTEPTT